MSRFLDSIITFRIFQKLNQKWDETNAFKLGIIDANGKVLRKYSELKTTEEKDAYTLLDRLVFNIKRMLEIVPLGKTRVATLFTSIALLKEELMERGVSENDISILEEKLDSILQPIMEDVAANSVGDGSSTSTNVGVPLGGMVRRRNWVDRKEKIFNTQVFELSPEDWNKAFKGRQKGQKWSDFFPDDHPVGKEIKAYHSSYPKKPILVKNSETGAHAFLKYGSEPAFK